MEGIPEDENEEGKMDFLMPTTSLRAQHVSSHKKQKWWQFKKKQQPIEEEEEEEVVVTLDESRKEENEVKKEEGKSGGIYRRSIPFIAEGELRGVNFLKERTVKELIETELSYIFDLETCIHVCRCNLLVLVMLLVMVLVTV
jgi:hypothetical protein